MGKYKVVKCPQCGFAEVTAASKSVRCFGCGRIWQLKSEMILFSSEEIEKVQGFLKKLKQCGEVEYRRAAEMFSKDP
ncbi:MAG: hypothetical protein N3F65_01390 [Nitrososphaeria archaeon]|nr:hypothetical protein [Aigarchaeota archaeon]MCX8187248.1 hypothetical protein [Nitrososphaeria archaeon]MDW8022039.1 hypothetical protein [Nitrososphaerota archaeon]